MKTVDYKLPADLHPALNPVEKSRKPGKVTDKDPTPADIVEYEYRVVPIRRAETNEEFDAMVAQDDAPKHILALKNQQRALLAQRIVREAAESKEVAAMFSGEDTATAGMDEAGRLAHVLAYLKGVEEGWAYSSKGAGTGGVVAAAKKALDRETAIAKLAEENKEVAQLKARLEKKLAELGLAI